MTHTLSMAFYALYLCHSGMDTTSFAQVETPPKITPDLASLSSEKITLILKRGPVFVSNYIYLENVVECQGETRICEEISGVELSDAPSSGKEKILTREEILERTSKEWPDIKISILGAPAIKVLSLSLILTEDTVTGQLNDLLKKIENSDEFRVNIEKIQMPSGLTLSDAEVKPVFPEITESNLQSRSWIRQHLSGPKRVKISLKNRDDLSKSKTVSVVVTFTLKEKVAIATRDLLRGDLVKTDDVTIDWYERESGSHDFVQSIDSLIGQRLRRSLSSGSPFPHDSTEKIKLLDRGQTAQMIIEKDGFTITGKVQTLESGSLGDIIDVIYATTKKKMKARITDSSTVELLY